MLIAIVGLMAALAAGDPVVDVREAFPQEVPAFYGPAQGLPSEEVSALILLPDGTPLAATKEGLAAFKDGRWSAGQPGPGFAVERLYSFEAGLWATGEGRAAHWVSDRWQPLEARGLPSVNCLAEFKGLLVGTSDGVWHATRGKARRIEGVNGPVSALAVVQDALVYAGTADGLFALQGEPKRLASGRVFEEIFPGDDSYGWNTRDVTALTTEGDRLWFGAWNGAGSLGGKLFTGKEGLPYSHFTCAAPGEAGVAWFGTERGALRYDSGRWAYRAGKRWLPDDRVNAIAVQSDGTAWIATPKGVSRIERRPMTLARKAAEFEDIIDKRHTRMGFVVRCLLKEEGNLDTAWINHTDNDGLYTSMYGAAEAFRYGATKDPEAKARARRCFEACKLLFDATGIAGFPARSVIPVDWPVDPNKGFGAEANLAMQKEDPLWKNIVPRWPKSADGKYYWKCDTSSDEIAGHYFFYGVYHDLVAETPEEKAAVVDIVRALTNHIVDNGFRLVDHDGLPTRWANWSPEYVNDIDGGWTDRGLQALEILSFLSVAHHVTGDAKFAETARMLRENHAYHINAAYGRWVFPPDHVVPWDNNLAFLSYYGLLKYERDPELLRTYRASLDRNWLFVSRQNDPFFNVVYAAMLPYPDQPVAEGVYPDFATALRKAADTLRGTPPLLLGWEMNNSHRLDVTLDPTPRQRPAYGWSTVTGEALPIEERSHIRINSDHFDLDHSQGGGTCEYEGTFYLLPYYMGLYHGFLK